MLFVIVGAHFFIFVPIRKAFEARSKRNYESLRQSILNREDPLWRHKLHLLTKGDQKLSEEQERQERAMMPQTHEEIVARAEFYRQAKELYRKNGWGEPPISFEVYPGVPKKDS
jgi:hypothetical protein